MAWVNFDEIKKAVSLEMVIAHYGIELRRVNAASLRGKCPLPTHGSDTSRASFTATLTKGVGGVWACQLRSCVAARDGKKGGNALDFVATMERCDLHEAAAKMQGWFGVPGATREESARSDQTENKPELFQKRARRRNRRGTNRSISGCKVSIRRIPISPAGE